MYYPFGYIPDIDYRNRHLLHRQKIAYVKQSFYKEFYEQKLFKDQQNLRNFGECENG